MGMTHPEGPLKSKKWTILVYYSADNNLSDYFSSAMARLLRTKLNDEVNVVIQFDGSKLNDSKRVLMTSEEGRTQVTILENDVEYDMGSARALADFVVWGREQFPARHVGLFIGSHGRGILNVPNGDGSFITPSEPAVPPSQAAKGVIRLASSPDDTSHSYIDEEALAAELEPRLNGEKIDLIAYESCLMGNLELMGVLARFARFAVASEYTIGINPREAANNNNNGKGLALHSIVSMLSRSPEMIPEVLGQAFVVEFEKNYRNFRPPSGTEVEQTDPATLALYDLTQAGAAVAALERLSEAIIASGQEKDFYTRLFAKALATEMVDSYGYIDSDRLLEMISITGTEVKEGADIVSRAVALSQATKKLVQRQSALHIEVRPSGVSVFFPSPTMSQAEFAGFIQYYEKLNVLKNGAWPRVITRFREFLNADRFQLLKGILERRLAGEQVRVRPSDSPTYNEYYLYLLLENELSAMWQTGEKAKVISYRDTILSDSRMTSTSAIKHIRFISRLVESR
jgi:hypothetical protein